MDTLTQNLAPEPMPYRLAAQQLYKLSPQQAALLEMLLGQRAVTWQQMVENQIAPSMKGARVLVSKLRKYFLRKEIDIENGYGTGYYLMPKPREKIVKELDAYRLR